MNTSRNRWAGRFTTRESKPPGDTPGGKLLYQGEDGWAMYDWNSKVTPAKDKLTGDEAFLVHATGDESFLVHACKTSDHTVREVYIFPDTHKACWRCQAALPDGLRALWIMHNGRI